MIHGRKSKSNDNTRKKFILGCLSGVILTLITLKMTSYNGEKSVLRSRLMKQNNSSLEIGVDGMTTLVEKSAQEQMINDSNGEKEPMAVNDVIKFFNEFYDFHQDIIPSSKTTYIKFIHRFNHPKKNTLN